MILSYGKVVMFYNCGRVLYFCMLLIDCVCCGDQVFIKRGCSEGEYSTSLVNLDDCLPGEVILVTEAYYGHPPRSSTCSRNTGPPKTASRYKSASNVALECNNKEFCVVRAKEKIFCDITAQSGVTIRSFPSLFLEIKYRCILVNSVNTSCPLLDAPEGGHVTFHPATNSTGKLLSEAFFGCGPGLTLIGSERRQCQGDATWSGTQPICSFPVSPCPRRSLMSYFRGHCYEFHLELKKWDEANITCEQQNGALADVDQDGLVDHLGWEADTKVGLEYFHTAKKGVVLLKSYINNWMNKSAVPHNLELPFICQYGPFSLEEQTTRSVETSTGIIMTTTESKATVAGQMQAFDFLSEKNFPWNLGVGILGGVVLILLLVIIVVSTRSKKKNKTKKRNQRKEKGLASSAQRKDVYSEAATVHALPPYATVEKTNREKRNRFSVQSDDTKDLDESVEVTGKPETPCHEVIEADTYDDNKYYENHTALFQKNKNNQKNKNKSNTDKYSSDTYTRNYSPESNDVVFHANDIYCNCEDEYANPEESGVVFHDNEIYNDTI